MSTLGSLLTVYVTISVFGAIMSPIVLFDSALPFVEKLGSEGRVVFGILAATLWPLLALCGVAWVLRAACRGVAQCVRLLVPKKPKPPRASFVDEDHVQPLGLVAARHPVMSKLKLDVHSAPLSKLIMNLANAPVLASNLPMGVTVKDVTDAVDELAREIDRRVPVDTGRKSRT